MARIQAELDVESRTELAAKVQRLVDRGRKVSVVETYVTWTGSYPNLPYDRAVVTVDGRQRRWYRQHKTPGAQWQYA